MIPGEVSKYRQLLDKFPGHCGGLPVSEEMALFAASPSPMMTALTTASRAAAEEDGHAEQMNQALTQLANSCGKMLEGELEDRPEQGLLCARAMTGAMVLYDQIQTTDGNIFKSRVDVKDCVKALKKGFPEDQSLVQAIRFCTQNGHLDAAPSSVRDLLAS